LLHDAAITIATDRRKKAFLIYFKQTYKQLQVTYFIFKSKTPTYPPKTPIWWMGGGLSDFLIKFVGNSAII
jgi:hypothetical protein